MDSGYSIQFNRDPNTNDPVSCHQFKTSETWRQRPVRQLPVPPFEEKDVKGMTLTGLKSRLLALGQSLNGTKDRLIDRLRAIAAHLASKKANNSMNVEEEEEKSQGQGEGGEEGGYSTDSEVPDWVPEKFLSDLSYVDSLLELCNEQDFFAGKVRKDKRRAGVKSLEIVL
jgi:hypothetical protein